MKRYNIYIKSHVDAPDYESIIFADNKTEAVTRAYNDLQGEYSRKEINDFLVEEKN